jgi:hypothetical protein
LRCGGLNWLILFIVFFLSTESGLSHDSYPEYC